MSASLIQQYRVSEDSYFDCKALSSRKIMTVLEEEVPTNLVPAVAVIREGQALFEITGRKGFVDGKISC